MSAWLARPASTARQTARCATPRSTPRGGTRGSAGAGEAGTTATILCGTGTLCGTGPRRATQQ
eukprot:7572813-Alexandrium_andersonii.AAC.1